MRRVRLFGVALASAVLLAGCHSVETKDRHKKMEDLASIHTQLATNYMRRGQFDVAEQELEAALDLDSSNAAANFAMATLKNTLHRPDQAMAYYVKAVKRAPSDSPMRLEYGAFLCRQGEPKKAIKEIKGVLDTPSWRPNGQAWFRLGECYFVQKDETQAENALREALATNKNMAPALMLLARIKYDQKSYLSARAWVQRYLALGRPNPRILLLGVRTERALGDLKSANHYKGQLLELFPSSPEVRMVDHTGTHRGK